MWKFATSADPSPAEESCRHLVSPNRLPPESSDPPVSPIRCPFYEQRIMVIALTTLTKRESTQALSEGATKFLTGTARDIGD
jgi:hypothetical protein